MGGKDIVDAAKNEAGVDERKPVSGAKPVGPLLADAFELVANAAEAGAHSGKNRASIPTGFYNIDEHTLGLWPGELTIVTGSPSVGKTAFAENVAVNAARRGVRMLLVSLGTKSSETAVRMLASQGRVSFKKLLKGLIGEDDWGKIADTSNSLASLDMFICDDPALTPHAICDLARSIRTGVEKMLVVIDGIELSALPDGDRLLDWPHAVGYTAALLKKLAREIDSAVLATMPYSPDTYNRDVSDYTRVLEALPPGAGEIADSVLHISREPSNADQRGTLDMNTTEVILAKHRISPPAKATLAYVPEYMLFADFVEASSTGYLA